MTYRSVHKLHFSRIDIIGRLWRAELLNFWDYGDVGGNSTEEVVQAKVKGCVIIRLLKLRR
jgi:hypothetical protein